MFGDYRTPWTPILLFLVLVTTGLWLAIFAIQGVPLQQLLPALLRFSFVVTGTVIAFALLNAVAWRWPLIRSVFKAPDVRGRWVGTYTSEFDKQPQQAAVEFHQTLLNLSAVAFGPDSRADAYSASLLSDADKNNFRIAYYYHAKRRPATSTPGDEHEGLCVLALERVDPRSLKGWYVNDRTPPTKGTIDLKFDSRRLKGAL